MQGWSDFDPEKALNGLLFGVATVLMWIGGKAGWQRTVAPSTPAVTPGSVEVAGALIDTKRIDALIAALDMNTLALTEKKLNLAKNTAALEALMAGVGEARTAIETHTRSASNVREQAERLAAEMRDLRDETRDLRDEMLRGGRRDR